MGVCFAPRCNHNSARESCRFFVFPKDPALLSFWRENVRKQSTPYSRLCSCHFVDGKKENGPTIFAHPVKKRCVPVPTKPARRNYNRANTSNPGPLHEPSHEPSYQEREMYVAEPSVPWHLIDTPTSNLLEALDNFEKMKDGDFNFCMLLFHEMKFLSSPTIKKNLLKYIQRGLSIALEQDQPDVPIS